MVDLDVEYFLGCLKESVKSMTCDRLENQIMQVMGFAGNRLTIKEKDIESLFCNLVSIVLKEVNTKEEGYNEFIKSFKRSYDAILFSKYKEGIMELEDNNSKSFVIEPILATTCQKRTRHMFFGVITKVSGKYECILVNKGYRPDDAFTYQRCINKSYEELINVFSEDKLLSVEEVYKQLSDVDAEGINAMDQKVGNCICKNMEASINSALCIAYPKYKKYGEIPAGVKDKIEVHRRYIDNLKESIKDIPQFRDRGFEHVLENKWKEYIYNKKFIERMNKERKIYLERKLSRSKILETFEDKYLKDKLYKIEKNVDYSDHNNSMRDKWRKYIYSKALLEKVNSIPNEYVADEKEFFDIFLEFFREDNIKDRLKYVSSKTLFEWYDNFLIFSRSRVKKIGEVLYLIERRWLDRHEIDAMELKELDMAVYFLKLLEEYFPMAVRELKLYYSRAYLMKINSENRYDVESLKLYQKGVMCNPYKIELEEMFESSYKNMLDQERGLQSNEYRFVLSKKDRVIYELLTRSYMRDKEKISKSLDKMLLRNKESIKKAFLEGEDNVNYLKINDVDLNEIKSDIKNMNYDDENGFADILSKVFKKDILECINFDNVNVKELFFKALRDGNFELTSMLIDWGIDLNIEDKKGNTPLMVACVGGNEDIVKLLYVKNAKFKEKYEGGCNIIPFINDYDIKMDIAKILIDKMCSREDLDRGIGELDNNPVLIYACRRNNIGLVKLLLEYGMDVNKTDQYGNTALKDICSMPENTQNIKIVKVLLENKIDVDKENYRNVTALMMACCNGNIEFVKMLLEASADVDKKNKNNRTALDMAIDNDDERIVKLLEDNILTREERKSRSFRGM